MARAKRRRPVADAARQGLHRQRRPDRAHHPWRPVEPDPAHYRCKTGQKRANTLSYARDGGDYLVVASKGGDPKAPGWYHNLKADPNIEINVGPKRFSVAAKPVTPDDSDYARLWQIVNNMRGNKNRYIGYQKRTSRPIPVIRLTPS